MAKTSFCDEFYRGSIGLFLKFGCPCCGFLFGVYIKALMCLKAPVERVKWVRSKELLGFVSGVWLLSLPSTTKAPIFSRFLAGAIYSYSSRYLKMTRVLS